MNAIGLPAGEGKLDWLVNPPNKRRAKEGIKKYNKP